MPPPEPVLSIIGVLNGVDLPNFSATIVANGYTVDDPTTLICSRADAIPIDTEVIK
jgi:hypothetical protein